jgi:hypothetical protein
MEWLLPQDPRPHKPADETGIDPVKEQRSLASRNQRAGAADSDLSAEATQ